MRCGVMDQFISCHGAAARALLLDCRSLAFRLEPIDPSVRLVVCNSMVHHEHAGGEYNLRRAECERGVALLASVLPGVQALRDVSLAQLAEHAAMLPDLTYRRCRHIVTENDRVLRAGAALQSRTGRGVRTADEPVARQHARRLRNKLPGDGLRWSRLRGASKACSARA